MVDLAVNIYPLSNYIIGTKEPNKVDKDADHLAVNSYIKEDMRTSVEGVLLVQQDDHPHVLVLQTGDTSYKLPGGRLKPGENEIECLKRKLSSKLAANPPSAQPDWLIGECVAQWWWRNFETTTIVPYSPPNISKPKLCKKIFLVHLTEREYFAVQKNVKLVAVPLHELHDNDQIYGLVLSLIPKQLSRFDINMIHQ